jgi:hypothetical protein
MVSSYLLVCRILIKICVYHFFLIVKAYVLWYGIILGTTIIFLFINCFELSCFCYSSMHDIITNVALAVASVSLFQSFIYLYYIKLH